MRYSYIERALLYPQNIGHHFRLTGCRSKELVTFFNMDAIAGTHRSPRVGRAADRYAHVVLRALDARNEAAMQDIGGGSSAPEPRAPRTQRRAARKPAKSGEDDGDSEPARRHVTPIFYDLADVADALSISTRAVQRLLQEGNFPRPRAVSSRRVCWLVSEIQQWAINRPVADLLPPANAGQRRAA